MREGEREREKSRENPFDGHLEFLEVRRISGAYLGTGERNRSIIRSPPRPRPRPLPAPRGQLL